MIGVYDSGVGGLTVLRELKKLMPEEDYIYYSDGVNCPYGPKEPEFVRQRAKEITDLLIAKGAEIIVVACNTATAAAITWLRSNYDIPFIGMEPALKPAALQSHTGVVGVLATAGTFKGRLYLDTLAKFADDVKVIQKVGTGLVEAVEQGDFSSPALLELLRGYIEPMVQEGADHIVLGCTHYPFLEEAIRAIAGPAVTIVNPAPAVARQTRHVLDELRTNNGTKKVEPLTRKGSTEYLSSGSTEVLLRLSSIR